MNLILDVDNSISDSLSLGSAGHYIYKGILSREHPNVWLGDYNNDSKPGSLNFHLEYFSKGFNFDTSVVGTR